VGAAAIDAGTPVLKASGAEQSSDMVTGTSEADSKQIVGPDALGVGTGDVGMTSTGVSGKTIVGAATIGVGTPFLKASGAEQSMETFAGTSEADSKQIVEPDALGIGTGDVGMTSTGVSGKSTAIVEVGTPFLTASGADQRIDLCAPGDAGEGDVQVPGETATGAADVGVTNVPDVADGEAVPCTVDADVGIAATGAQNGIPPHAPGASGVHLIGISDGGTASGLADSSKSDKENDILFSQDTQSTEGFGRDIGMVDGDGDLLDQRAKRQRTSGGDAGASGEAEGAGAPPTADMPGVQPPKQDAKAKKDEPDKKPKPVAAKAKKAEKDPLLLGCSKCRGSKKGCGQCRNPEFNGSRWQKK
jgi:microcompartment protein CcmK/EutM